MSLLEGYTLHRAAFTEEEQQLLLTALRSLPGDAGQGTAGTLSKLSALFRRREPDWLQVELSRWGSAGADNAKFVQLKEAILSRRVLSFTYVGASGQTTRRSVLPARLVFKGRDWYLQGFCLERAAYRTFKLTRMLEPEPGAPFSAPLSPAHRGWRAAGGLLRACPPALLPALAYRVYDEFDEGCVTRGADGSLVVSVSFPEDPWLYGYLLSFGLGVEVLEPERLRKRLALLAGKMAAHHGNHDTGVRITVIGWSHLNHRRNLT
ncbi:WYL domain-containing protein [Flavonifractor plautii]|nr:WYL domain-containing protein [Flavonifractor plautii]